MEAQIRALREEADQEAEAAEQRRRQERRRQKARLQQRLARKRAKKQAAKERRAAEQRAKMQAEEAAKVREQLRRMKEDDMEQELRSSVGFGTSGMPAGLNSSNMSLTGGLPSIGKPAAASPSGVTSNTSGGGNGMAGSPPSSVGFNPMPESSIAALKRQTLAPQGSARRLQALGTPAASATTSDARTSSETRTRRRRSLARRGSPRWALRGSRRPSPPTALACCSRCSTRTTRAMGSNPGSSPGSSASGRPTAVARLLLAAAEV